MFAVNYSIRPDREPENVETVFSNLRTVTKLANQERHLLLVEDQATDVALARELLEASMPDYQWSIVDRPSMAHALPLIHDKHFDMVMLDLTLQDMEGPETVSALRTVAPSLPIILYSGSSDLNMLQRAMMNGAQFCIEKGITMPRLVRAMIQCALAPEAHY